jgi:predicted nucleic acid-binding Zn ribbon protein
MSTVHRIPQLPAVIFKGHGWYSTDHRSPSTQKADTQARKNDKAESSMS